MASTVLVLTQIILGDKFYMDTSISIRFMLQMRFIGLGIKEVLAMPEYLISSRVGKSGQIIEY